MSVKFCRHHLALLIWAIAASPQPSYALQVGDRIHLNLPVENLRSTSPITGVRASLLASPAWLKLLPSSSDLGPKDIQADQTATLRFSFRVQALPSGGSDVLTTLLTTDSVGLAQSSWKCDFESSNGFLNSRHECVDESGRIGSQTWLC